MHSAPPLSVDWDTHHHSDDDPLERLSGGSDYPDSVFSGDS